MPVSFLDLLPKPPTETVTVDWLTEGPQEIELSGITFGALADISKRYPAFARVLDGGGGSMYDHPDALVAVIAASLGHPGKPELETHISRFTAGVIFRIANVAIRLTFPQRQADPLSVGVNGRGDDASPQILPSQLNS